MIMVRKKNPIPSGLVVFTSLFLMLAGTTFAANLEKLSNDADVILFGKTIKVECQWAKSSLNILSHAQFQVEICVKGNYAAGDHITIETYGGVINGMKQKIPNSAAFHHGEYALVFLKAGKDNLYYVTGGKEGKIPFTRKKGMQSVEGGEKLDRMIRNVQLVLGK